MSSKHHPQPATLIAILLDPGADLGGRDDAAMDLCGFDEPEAEAALLRIATDPNEEEILIDSAGESLAQIWSRRNAPPASSQIAALAPEAQLIAIAILRVRWPDLRSGDD